MLALERKNKIKNELQKNNKVVISELSKSFNVTEQTIRRDLDEMEKSGLAIRSHGGALLNNACNNGRHTDDLEIVNYDLKEKIALCLQPQIQDGMTLMVDSGSTTKLAISKINKHKKLTIITNSFTLIEDLSYMENLTFISTGGFFSTKTRAFLGHDAIHTIKRYNVDMAILSCNALALDLGYMDLDKYESEIKCTMSEQAICTTMLADHSKFNQRSLINTLPFNAVDKLITDTCPDDAWLNFLHRHNNELIYPKDTNNEQEGDFA